MAATNWKEPKLLAYCLLSYCKYVLIQIVMCWRKSSLDLIHALSQTPLMSFWAKHNSDINNATIRF